LIKKGDKVYDMTPIMYMSDYNNSLMREPAILNLFSKDIYLEPLGYDEGTNQQANANGETISLEKGKTIEFKGTKITFDKFDVSPETMSAMQQGKDFQLGADLTLEANGKTEEFELFRKSISGQIQFTDYVSKNSDLKIQLLNLNAQMIELAISSPKATQEPVVQKPKQEVLTVTARIKPYISLLWIGVIVMVVGFFVAVARRLKESLL
jgi:cytochrome c-type biogenesis protein CcmF